MLMQLERAGCPCQNRLWQLVTPSATVMASAKVVLLHVNFTTSRCGFLRHYHACHDSQAADAKAGRIQYHANVMHVLGIALKKNISRTGRMLQALAQPT